MKPRKALIATLVVPLLALTTCSNDDEPSPSKRANSSTPKETGQKPVAHQLDETVTVGNTVTISDIKLSTKGCTLEGKDPKKFIKFQIIATVENGTPQEIPEILWPSDFRYKDSKGMTSTELDNTDGSPCSSGEQSEFNGMGPGEKRRAAITLVAPKDTVEMTYKTDLIPGAQPIVWDVKGEFKKLKPKAFAPSTEAEAPASQPSPVQPAPSQVGPSQPSSVFNQPGNGYQCPGTDAYVNNPADCTSHNLGGDPIYDEVYPGGYPKQPSPKQPSPWVQGQIDWANCLEQGNTEQECRDQLN